jgi:hypothetical protein
MIDFDFLKIIIEHQVNKFDNVNIRGYQTFDKLKNKLYVTVSNRSRSYKGDGILVGECHIEWKGYSNRKLLIWDPTKNIIHEVTPHLVNLHESYKKQFVEYLIWMIKNHPTEMTIDKSEEVTTENLKLSIHYISKQFVNYLNITKNFIELPKDAIYVEEEKRMKKYNEFKEEKMKTLIAWAKTKVSDRDPMDLAEIIWKRKYENFSKPYVKYISVE